MLEIEEIIVNIGTCVVTNAIANKLSGKKQKSVVPPVRINPLIDPERQERRPEILVATFSGYRCPDDMDIEKFKEFLKHGDYKALNISEKSIGIGQTIKTIEIFPSLRKVYLIATRTKHKDGVGSFDSVYLLKQYVQEEMKRDCDIIADREHCIPLGEDTIDTYVAEKAFEITKNIFISLDDDYQPKRSKTLVDITGGTKSMSMGALLACLNPNQDVFLMGANYTAHGKPVYTYPMIIHFEAQGVKRLCRDQP